MALLLKTFGSRWILLVLPAFAIVGCSERAPTEASAPPPIEVAEIRWGLNDCPWCTRRSPKDTEGIALQEAISMHVDGQCVDAALGSGAMAWLEDQVVMGNIWVDEDVYTEDDDYFGGARGYWVEPSIRYQYDNIPIYVAQETIHDYSREELAITLVHELAHEYGIGNEEGYDHEAEWIGQLCTS